MEGSNERAELRGIIPNSFAHIFGQIAKAEAHQKFLVRVSYFEIYMEQIRDLLTKKIDRERAVVTSLEVKEDKEKGKRTCIGLIDWLIDWLIMISFRGLRERSDGASRSFRGRLG